MITFKNKNALDKYTRSLNTFKENETCFCEEENKIYIYKEHTWEEMKTEGGIKMSAYEINQQLAVQMPTIEEKDYPDVIKEIEEYRITNSSPYYMILCRELSYYTIFARNKLCELSLEEAILDYCITTGNLKAVDLTEDKSAIEIWIEIDGTAHAFYLFDYSMGIIYFN